MVTTTKTAADEQLKQRCIERCLQSHRICLETIQHCLQKGGKHAEANHIAHLIDCAETNLLAANLMTRNSPHYSLICGVCAEISGACAEDCARMSEDEQMRKCAETSRRSAEGCRELSRSA